MFLISRWDREKLKVCNDYSYSLVLVTDVQGQKTYVINYTLKHWNVLYTFGMFACCVSGVFGSEISTNDFLTFVGGLFDADFFLVSMTRS